VGIGCRELRVEGDGPAIVGDGPLIVAPIIVSKPTLDKGFCILRVEGAGCGGLPGATTASGQAQEQQDETCHRIDSSAHGVASRADPLLEFSKNIATIPQRHQAMPPDESGV
jgi:hypothetical protein